MKKAEYNSQISNSDDIDDVSDSSSNTSSLDETSSAVKRKLSGNRN